MKKVRYLKTYFLAFSLTFILFSCVKDSFEDEVSTMQNRPENGQDAVREQRMNDIVIE